MKSTLSVFIIAAISFFPVTLLHAYSGSPPVSGNVENIQSDLNIHSAGAEVEPSGSPARDGGIQGDIELAGCFEVIPGGEIVFDLMLWNPDSHGNTSIVALYLDLPTGPSHILFEREITLGASDTLSRGISRLVPEGLNLYGRYTLNLLIDGLLADSFEFDLNSRDEIIVRWDDGVVGGAWTWYEADNEWAISGWMPEGAIIDEIGTHVISEGDSPYWPWPDAVHQAIELRLYDNDGPGEMPGTLLYTSGDAYADPATGDVVAYPGVSAPLGTFYVSNLQLTDYPGCEAIAVDNSLDYPDHMFVKDDTGWHGAEGLIDGDLMIWAIGHINGLKITLGSTPGK
jgi:hypothetical protein